MGGRAFKDIETPRLSHDQYKRLQAKVQALLEQYFEGVATPAPDPDKQDHGDVDFIVHTPTGNATIEYIGRILHAKDIVPGMPTTNYAVPFEGVYAQVDVHRCEKHEHATRLFLNSYGRLGRFDNLSMRLSLTTRLRYRTRLERHAPSLSALLRQARPLAGKANTS
jgi:hypothetical protein